MQTTLRKRNKNKIKMQSAILTLVRLVSIPGPSFLIFNKTHKKLKHQTI